MISDYLSLCFNDAQVNYSNAQTIIIINIPIFNFTPVNDAQHVNYAAAPAAPYIFCNYLINMIISWQLFFIQHLKFIHCFNFCI